MPYDFNPTNIGAWAERLKDDIQNAYNDILTNNGLKIIVFTRFTSHSDDRMLIYTFYPFPANHISLTKDNSIILEIPAVKQEKRVLLDNGKTCEMKTEFELADFNNLPKINSPDFEKKIKSMVMNLKLGG